MSKNKENLMKPNKRQKGNNAVLIIAVGKNPKMGPGSRDYGKKGMKKAFNLLKRDDARTIARKRAERAEKLRAKKARKEAQQGKKPKTVEVKQAPKLTDTTDRRFDSKELPKLIERFSLGEKDSPTTITSDNKRRLARMLNVNPNDIREDSNVLENRRVFDALKQLGQQRFAERVNERKIREARMEGRKKVRVAPATGDVDEDMDSAYDAMFGRRDEKKERLRNPYHYSRLVDPRQGTLSTRLSDEERQARFLQNVAMGRSTGAMEEERERRKDRGEIVDEFGELSREPSTVFTQPFGHTGKTMGGFAGGDLDKPLGRVAPRVPPRMSSPQEEEEEPELPEYPQFATGEPMDLAFRILKDGCLPSHRKKNKENKEKKGMCKGDGCAGCDDCASCDCASCKGERKEKGSCNT